ncbi:hypothetical protein BDV59DRAFT_9807 [Aspergillus ambiguus]|uniref:uncharacterized protein n=1 Tax=Aspergillus ambiguus TaxID=176160 RepID=UPI003CCE37CF
MSGNDAVFFPFSRILNIADRSVDRHPFFARSLLFSIFFLPRFYLSQRSQEPHKRLIVAARSHSACEPDLSLNRRRSLSSGFPDRRQHAYLGLGGTSLGTTVLGRRMHTSPVRAGSLLVYTGKEVNDSLSVDDLASIPHQVTSSVNGNHRTACVLSPAIIEENLTNSSLRQSIQRVWSAMGNASVIPSSPKPLGRATSHDARSGSSYHRLQTQNRLESDTKKESLNDKMAGSTR